MRKPYTERRGETQIFGYINESGQKIQIRTFPASSMDMVRTRLQLMHIQEEYCLTEKSHKTKKSHKGEDEKVEEIGAELARKAQKLADGNE